MGVAKKHNVFKVDFNNKIKRAKPSDFTPAQWKRLTSGEPLFPEKLAKANEMLAKMKWMDNKSDK